jgi:hypothetical protein
MRGLTFQKVGNGAAASALVVGSYDLSGQPTYSGDNEDEIYSAFSFQDGATTDYGWFDGTIVGAGIGVSYYLEEVVYDDSGAKIATGQVTPAAVPEPASIGLMMIGAVAVGGAAAVRRMKAARAAATA